MKLRFLYHAEAAAATGQLTLPYQEMIPIPASVSVPLNGGHATASVEDFSHRGIISFRRAEAHVFGAYSEKDKAYGAASTVCVEGVNILNVVTCDRVILRLAAKYPDGDVEPTFNPLGSHFDNLRIAGHPIHVDMATYLFTQHGTWSNLNHTYEQDEAFHNEIASLSMVEATGRQLPLGHGTLGVTLARNLFDHLPRGLERRDHGIYVPHFGTVYLGEYFVSAHAHRLLMLHVDLGCAVEGCGGIASGQNNGQTYP
jgi:hypothetical protein